MLSYNRDHLNWVIRNIKKRVNAPYMMANEPLADDIFPNIKKEFPEAIMIKIGIEQWITVTKRGQNALIKLFKNRRSEYEKSINEVESAIEKLI